MDELRARLDAPLFHRDQGLGAPLQLPRLREIGGGPDVAPAALAVKEPPPMPSASFPPPLASQRAAQPLPQRQPEPVVAQQPELGQSETEALLAVLATLETSANRLQELNVVPAVAKPTLEPRPTVIQPELDRLALLPDVEEPAGPVEIPQIRATEQHPVMAVPSLSDHEMYNPRATPTVAPRRDPLQPALEAATARRRRPRPSGLLRRLVSLLVIVAFLAGGLFAAKYYLLATKWDPDVEVIAKEVALARGIEFHHAVEVSVLDPNAYAARLASYGLGVKGGNDQLVASELRALGLLAGVFDLQVIGLAALPETPAFYDAGSEKIYVVDQLPAETYRFAMQRALAAALLDQEYNWGSAVRGASPAVVRGTRALYEADALATATGMMTVGERALVLQQRAELLAAYGLASPSHFGTVAAGRLGVALRAYIESIPVNARDAVLRGTAITDGQALDLRRLIAGVEVVPEGLRSQGMLFWYHALAARLDPATAWNAALAIRGDDVFVTAPEDGACVSALLTVSAEALDAVGGAFAAWAAAAPAESQTAVVASLADGVGQIAIDACDPGATAITNTGVPPLSLGGAPLRSEQYRQLLAAQPTLSPAQAACAVYGGDNVSASDERWIVDPIEGWAAPGAHPAADPSRAACAGL